jgi:hypothetical protein
MRDWRVPSQRGVSLRLAHKGGDTMGQTVRQKARIRQGRDDDRPTEDDIARKHLGPRGEEGKPDTAKMTQDSELQTPTPIDPGHTA